jgi:hypothetical protein
VYRSRTDVDDAELVFRKEVVGGAVHERVSGTERSFERVYPVGILGELDAELRRRAPEQTVALTGRLRAIRADGHVPALRALAAWHFAIALQLESIRSVVSGQSLFVDVSKGRTGGIRRTRFGSALAWLSAEVRLRFLVVSPHLRPREWFRATSCVAAQSVMAPLHRQRPRIMARGTLREGRRGTGPCDEKIARCWRAVG